MITKNLRKYAFTDFVQVLAQIETLENTNFVETTKLVLLPDFKALSDHIQYSMHGFPYIYTPFYERQSEGIFIKNSRERFYVT